MFMCDDFVLVGETRRITGYIVYCRNKITAFAAFYKLILNVYPTGTQRDW